MACLFPGRKGRLSDDKFDWDLIAPCCMNARLLNMNTLSRALQVGLTIFLVHVVLIPFTGCSINPGACSAVCSMRPWIDVDTPL